MSDGLKTSKKYCLFAIFLSHLKKRQKHHPLKASLSNGRGSWVVGASVGQVVSVIVNTELKVNSSYLIIIIILMVLLLIVIVIIEEGNGFFLVKRDLVT